ncbi:MULTISPECIES: putative leader peptide [unclassified Streptomyces]|uniref:putative leader peptide n=1 Tax=unclassified Streptomyces TaxID=2593676 RepID=UPI002D2189C6|nr:putative leader peptide [Streptomyces sp. HmicA12]
MVGWSPRRRTGSTPALPHTGNTPGSRGVVTHDERRADARRTEVRLVRHLPRPRALHPRRVVRLHSRPHIDLQRVAAALCRP